MPPPQHEIRNRETRNREIENREIENRKSKKREIERQGTKILVYLAMAFFMADLIYKTVNDISYVNRENCILYKTLPTVWFLFFEYFVELFFIVVAGVFAAVLLESGFARFKRFYPQNSITAFLYGSLLPVCACSTIPLIGSMRGKLPLGAIITFVVAAPLLSPYIIVLSMSVLGLKYTLLRIAAAFILAAGTGLIVDRIFRGDRQPGMPALSLDPLARGRAAEDSYLKTYSILKGLFPYFIVAGVMGMALEWAAPSNFLTKLQISNNIYAIIISILIGIPLYFCHGAEILLLRPLIHQSGFTDGAAIAFSLASTSICMTSLAMTVKFLGKKLTLILVGTLAILIFMLGLSIDMLFA